MKKLFVRLMLPMFISGMAAFLFSCDSGVDDEGEKQVEISAELEDIYFDAVGSAAKDVAISGVEEWSATVADDAKEWLHAVRNGDMLNITVDDYNSEFKDRAGKISVSTTLENVKPLVISVTQNAIGDAEDYVNLRVDEANYYGDELMTGTGRYRIMFIDGQDKNIQLILYGFGDMAEDPDNYVLTPGTYELGQDDDYGKMLTFEKGVGDDDYWAGTRALDNGAYIVMTGGTLTIEYSGTEYVIRTDFTGVDLDTGEVKQNIKYRYRGSIFFDNDEPVVYREECALVRINHTNDYYRPGGSRYDMFMYVGRTDSQGSLIPPYQVLAMEMYADILQSPNPGKPMDIATGTYNCRIGLWEPFTCMIAVEGFMGTRYYFYSAATPDAYDYRVNLTSGTMTIDKNKVTGLYTIETDFKGTREDTGKPSKVMLSYTGELIGGMPL